MNISESLKQSINFLLGVVARVLNASVVEAEIEPGKS